MAGWKCIKSADVTTFEFTILFSEVKAAAIVPVFSYSPERARVYGGLCQKNCYALNSA